MNLLKMNDQITYTYLCPVMGRQVKRAGKVISCNSSIGGNVIVCWPNGIHHRISTNPTVEIQTINGQSL